MTDAQLQTVLRQYRGSDPQHRQSLLSRLQSLASNCPQRETREQAIALLPHLVEAEKTIQADAAKVVELERRLQAVEAGMMQPVAYREPVLYSRHVVTMNITPIAKTGVVVVGIGAAIYFVGVPILAGCAVGLFGGWLALSGLIGSGSSEVKERTPGGANGGQINVEIHDNHGTIIINQNNNNG
jgi:hypothetical protein